MGRAAAIFRDEHATRSAPSVRRVRASAADETADRERSTVLYERKSIVILIAEDDEDDCLIARETFEDLGLANDIRFVGDGEELLEYLRREGKYERPEDSPRPGLILLDLNMPRKNGAEALVEIKADEDLRRIPVFVLTTSHDEQDIHQTYELGGSTFIRKPFQVEELIRLVSTLTRYKLEIVDPEPNWRDEL